MFKHMGRVTLSMQSTTLMSLPAVLHFNLQHFDASWEFTLSHMLNNRETNNQFQ